MPRFSVSLLSKFRVRVGETDIFELESRKAKLLTSKIIYANINSSQYITHTLNTKSSRTSRLDAY